MTALQRSAIVAEACAWEKTPYRDHGAVKHAGADCALYPLAVYRAVLTLPEVALPDYTQQWWMHKGEELYLNYVLAIGAVEISEDELLPGDFALFKVGWVHSHGAIVLEWPRMIHAVNPRGVVLADASIDERLSRRQISLPRFFTFPG